jgi:predicted XRE-type DNA-binding protein
VESFASVWDALADTPEQAAFDLWQARAAAKASKALSGVKALKPQPA